MAPRWIVLCVTLCVASQIAWAKTYMVGDELGWTFTNETSGEQADYDAWAKKYTFYKDDVLVFSYTVDKQNIYTFDTFDGWQNCNFTQGFMLDNGTAGSSQWILTAEGHYEFASAMFCHQGQKFHLYAVDPELLITQVVVPEGPAPAPEAQLPITNVTTPTSPSTKTPTTPPPPPPSASSPMILTQAVMLVVACVMSSLVVFL